MNRIKSKNLLLDSIANGFIGSDDPPTLYHYTGINGLKGIIEGEIIHATNIKFLNDKTEFDIANTIIKDIVEERIKASTEPNLSGLKLLLEKFMSRNPDDVYLSSFCASKDLLSQWRGYSNSSGYSIGFNYHKLKESLVEMKIWLHKCIYSENEQKSVISNVIDGFIAFYELAIKSEKMNKSILRGMGMSDDIPTYLDEYVMLLSIISASLKNHNFREEREYRLVYIKNISTHIKKVHFKIKNEIMIPYVEVPFSYSKLIDEIIVGPTANKELVDASFRIYFSENDKTTKLIHSEIPLRSVG